jgi:chromosomal replication initiator protein
MRGQGQMMTNDTNPDLQGKLKVLRDTANAEHMHLPDDVALYIAQQVTTSRECEATLIRLIAYVSLTGQELTPMIARDVLDKIITARVH